MTEKPGATLPPTEGEEEIMPPFSRQCPECAKPGSNHEGNVLIFELSSNIDLHGIATCRFHPQTKIPILFIGGYVDSTAPTLPVNESPRLVGAPEGIKQDIKEAEECHFNSTYKASAIMCRRALQLAYEHLMQEILDADKQYTLGALLKVARGQAPLPIAESFLYQTDAVKALGDEGAHRVATVDPSDVRAAIHDSVVVLNEIYQLKPEAR